MDWQAIKEKGSQFIKKYRYAVLILLVGILFMTFPFQKEENIEMEEPIEQTHEKEMQEALALILSKIDGAGRVEVLLTQRTGEAIIYQTDSDDSVSSDSTDVNLKTVIISDSDRAEQPVVRQVLPPTYLGAIIVCQGGDSPSVKLAIVEAVSNATGLSADKITVLKMK